MQEGVKIHRELLNVLTPCCNRICLAAASVGISCLFDFADLTNHSVLLAAERSILLSTRTASVKESDKLVSELNRLQKIIKTQGQPIGLNAAIREGIINNPKLSQAFSQIQQAEWGLIKAQRGWYPTIQLTNQTPFVGYSWNTFVSDNYAKRDQKNTGGEQEEKGAVSKSDKVTTSSQNITIAPGVSVNWTFLDPTRQPNINSQSAEVQKQKYLFFNAARGLILDIQQAYFKIQSSQQLIEDFQRIYAINRQQLEILEERQKIGMVTILDVEQTRSQLFQQLSQLVQYTNNYIDQTSNLAELVNLPSKTLPIPNEEAKLYGSWQPQLDETVKNALSYREELLSDLAAAEVAQWNAIAALKSYLPKFQLVGGGNLTGKNGYNNVPVNKDPQTSYTRTRNWAASAGIGFTWQIFDGGIQDADAQISFARERSFQSSFKLNENQIVQQVRSSYGKLKTSVVAYESAQRSYKSAEIAQQAARARFDVGVGDITSVVQTISQLSSASQQVSTAILAYNNAIVELYRYSATWPQNTQFEVEERIKSLRSNPNS